MILAAAMSVEADQEWLRQALAGNDGVVRSGPLDAGRLIAAGRTAIFDRVVGDWAACLGRETGHDGSFAVVALGGTGRQEVCPCSDLDYAVLLAGEIENHPLLAEIQRQTLHSDEFERLHGFEFQPYPFDLESVTAFDDIRQLNSFLDMRAIHDPGGLAPRFRSRIAETFDPFEHFLHLRSFWISQWERAADQAERLDRFDIKNDGLRLFLAAVWLLGGKDFRHSHEVYATLDPRVLHAYGLLLRVRQFIHLRCRNDGKRRTQLPDGRHAEDVLGFDDFVSFGDMLDESAGEERRFGFSNEVRARLLAARRQVAVFAKGVIGQELRSGRAVASNNPHAFGAGGLRAATRMEEGIEDTGGPPVPHLGEEDEDTGEPPVPHLWSSNRDKSRTALALLAAAQHYDLPIDPSELQGVFRDAGDWLEPVPELGDLFYERGSLAGSFTFLAQIPGAEERLFPGYGRFEASLDERVMTERKSLRGALANAKLRALESWVAEGRKRLDEAVSGTRLKDLDREGVSIMIEAAQLDPDPLAAVKLALKTKRLPLTADDAAARRDPKLPLLERFASGFSEIPLDNYYRPYIESCGLPQELIGLTEFLIRERRTLKRLAEIGLSDARLVQYLAEMCGDEQRLRALFVFTHADRAEWESEDQEPARWFSIRELYFKAMLSFRPPSASGKSLIEAGFSEEDLEVLQGFGTNLVGGAYRRHALRFASRLIRLAEDPAYDDPKAAVIRDGGSLILGVASRDFRGLAAIITGSLLTEGIGLAQAHLFSSARHSLALDFFHLVGNPGPDALAGLPARIEDSIRRRVFHPGDAAAVGGSLENGGERSLEEWRPGLFCLRFATREPKPVGAIIHALVQTVFRDLRGNVHALKANTARGGTFVSVYHSMPPEVSLDEARNILARL